MHHITVVDVGPVVRMNRRFDEWIQLGEGLGASDESDDENSDLEVSESPHTSEPGKRKWVPTSSSFELIAAEAEIIALVREALVQNSSALNMVTSCLRSLNTTMNVYDLEMASSPLDGQRAAQFKGNCFLVMHSIHTFFYCLFCFRSCRTLPGGTLPPDCMETNSKFREQHYGERIQGERNRQVNTCS